MSRALVLRGATALGDLGVSEVVCPEPSPGELVVEVHAAAINRSDVISALGLMPITSFPRVPGRDFAGIVVEGPDDLCGVEVWGTGGGDLGFTRDGSHAEHVVLPCEAVVPKPAALTFDQAGSAGLAYVAASMALRRSGTLRPGATVLVTGAVGGVGGAAVSLAQSKGAQVVGAVLGREECRIAEAAGIDVVVDTGVDDLGEAVRSATHGAGADLAVDTVGAPLLDSVIEAMGMGGGVCFLAAQGAVRAHLDPQSFYRRDLTLAGLNTGRITSVEAAEILRVLVPPFERRGLAAPRVAASYSLDEAAAAYAAVERGGPAGRVVLRPHD